MPSIIEKALITKAVFWPKLIPDGFPNGGISLPPVEINSRWIDGEDSRIQQVESVVLVDRDLETGGFIRKGPISELIPANAETYPPTTPTTIGQFVGYWAFEDDILATTGPDFSLDSGTIKFDTGAFGSKAMFNDDDDFDIETDSAVTWTSELGITISMFVKLAPDTAGDVVSVTIDLGGGATITLDEEGVKSLGSEWDLGDGWASGFVSVILVFQSGAVPTLFYAGFPVTEDITGSTFSPIASALLNISSDLNDAGGSGNFSVFGLDDLRAYNIALTGREAQLLAAVHPNLYSDAEEILRFKGGDSIDGSRRVRKIWLGEQ